MSYHIIAVEPEGRCQFCGEEKELRPYGPNGEWVCFQCGMKDQAAAERGFLKRLQAIEHEGGEA